MSFKFQSDSINTAMPTGLVTAPMISLNSNLILLIQALDTTEQAVRDTLNSNLILLIRSFVWHRFSSGCPLNSNLILLILSLAMYHVLSLLTLNSNLILLIRFCRLRPYQSQPTLNSNLILLIRGCESDSESERILFKFQSDSINTKVGFQRAIIAVSFKFQSDSINTTSSPRFHTSLYALNSNLILLIHGIQNKS